MNEGLIDRVLDFVDAIPLGQVATYGEVGLAAGCGPRQVGRIMRYYGASTCWWRVVRADGTSSVADRARPHWISEGLPLKDDGIDLKRLQGGAAQQPVHCVDALSTFDKP